MEDYFVSHFGKFGKSNGRLLTRIREGKGLLRIMNGGWKIILYRVLESLEKNASQMEDYCEGKGLLRIMNGGWKIILYRILEIGKFGKGCKSNGRLL